MTTVYCECVHRKCVCGKNKKKVVCMYVYETLNEQNEQTERRVEFAEIGKK